MGAIRSWDATCCFPFTMSVLLSSTSGFISPARNNLDFIVHYFLLMKDWSASDEAYSLSVWCQEFCFQQVQSVICLDLITHISFACSRFFVIQARSGLKALIGLHDNTGFPWQVYSMKSLYAVISGGKNLFHYNPQKYSTGYEDIFIRMKPAYSHYQGLIVHWL